MKSQEPHEIKSKLPYGSYKILAQMMAADYEAGTISKKYTAGTIEKMMNGHRKIKPEVLATATRYIEMINPQN